MACDEKKRVSVALPTIDESDEENIDLIEDILRISRKKKECRTPRKKEASVEKSKTADSSARKRTPRHCAEQAREKITTLFNQGDKYGRSIYAVSENETSEDSCEAFLPIADEEIMPKGECNPLLCCNIYFFSLL